MSVTPHSLPLEEERSAAQSSLFPPKQSICSEMEMLQREFFFEKPGDLGSLSKLSIHRTEQPSDHKPNETFPTAELHVQPSSTATSEHIKDMQVLSHLAQQYAENKADQLQEPSLQEKTALQGKAGPPGEPILGNEGTGNGINMEVADDGYSTQWPAISLPTPLSRRDPRLHTSRLTRDLLSASRRDATACSLIAAALASSSTRSDQIPVAQQEALSESPESADLIPETRPLEERGTSSPENGSVAADAVYSQHHNVTPCSSTAQIARRSARSRSAKRQHAKDSTQKAPRSSRQVRLTTAATTVEELGQQQQIREALAGKISTSPEQEWSAFSASEDSATAFEVPTNLADSLSPKWPFAGNRQLDSWPPKRLSEGVYMDGTPLLQPRAPMQLAGQEPKSHTHKDEDLQAHISPLMWLAEIIAKCGIMSAADAIKERPSVADPIRSGTLQKATMAFSNGDAVTPLHFPATSSPGLKYRLSGDVTPGRAQTKRKAEPATSPAGLGAASQTCKRKRSSRHRQHAYKQAAASRRDPQEGHPKQSRKSAKVSILSAAGQEGYACPRCGARTTPLWRWEGPILVCNACGLRQTQGARMRRHRTRHSASQAGTQAGSDTQIHRTMHPWATEPDHSITKNMCRHKRDSWNSSEHTTESRATSSSDGDNPRWVQGFGITWGARRRRSGAVR